MKKLERILLVLISFCILGCEYIPVPRGEEIYVFPKVREEENKIQIENQEKEEAEQKEPSQGEMTDENQEQNLVSEETDTNEPDEKNCEEETEEADNKENTDDTTIENTEEEVLDNTEEKLLDNSEKEVSEEIEEDIPVVEEVVSTQEDVQEIPEEKTDDEIIETNSNKEEESDIEEDKKESPSEFNGQYEIIEPAEITERLWNILIYMSADNNLEAAAIEDLCEMELSDLNMDSVSVFVLLDRSEAYDTSNGDWAGTRLLRVKTGKRTDAKKIISEEIECKDLGLNIGGNVELDMSSPYVLSDTISYLHKRYPANNYGLIMWGHGTGWRSDENTNENSVIIPGGYKGFAYDETSHTYMTLKQLGSAIKSGLNGNKFGFIGFDTCFGAELEVMYELKDYAEYAVGSEGLLLTSGWNYKTFFNAIEKDKEKTSFSICSTLSEKFKEWYESSPGASFSMVKMENISAYYDCFDDYMSEISELIVDRSIRDDVLGILYSNQNCKAERYTYGSVNNDVYLDIHSVINALNEYFSEIPSLKKHSTVFGLVEDTVIVDGWNSLGTHGGLGVYFHTLGNSNFFARNHPAAYIQGKTSEQISFVTDSHGYVPNINNKSTLLEKLFYEIYE